jgi:hypothetical protein
MVEYREFRRRQSRRPPRPEGRPTGPERSRSRTGSLSNGVFRTGDSARRRVIQDSINLRRHRNACQFYREDWGAADALYRIYCLLGTPPETVEEQERCLRARRACWRLAKSAEPATANAAAPADASPDQG